MVSKIKRFRIPERDSIIFVFFAALCLAVHGLFIFSQGFYWDDWSQIFLRIKFGDGAYWEYFLADRPTSAWTNILYARFLQNDPRLWHIFIIILKFSTSVLCYKILQKIWPDNKLANLVITSLYILCPIFSQLYISVAYSQHYLNALLFLLSVFFLIRSAQAPQRLSAVLFGGLSILFMILQLSITEYFAFLELIKLPVLFFVFRAQALSIKSAIKKSLQFFAPVLILFGVYSVYRLNYTKIFPIQEADPPKLLYDFLFDPFSALGVFIQNVILDFTYIFTDFIGELFSINVGTLFRPFSFISIFLSILLAFITYQFLSRIQISAHSADPKPMTGYVIFAFLWIFLSLLPFWVIGDTYVKAADRPHADRIFLASVLGVATLFFLPVQWFVQSRSKMLFAVCLLSALFYHQSLEANNMGRQQTALQNDIFWQLRIRMPILEGNTAIVDEEVMFPFQGNFSTASAINVLYDNPINADGTTPLWIFHSEGKLFEERSGYHVKKRNFEFIAPPDQSIFIDYENQFANCVWIFSPEDIDNPHLTEIQKSWIPHSDISRIKMDVSSLPDTVIFGAEPENWCAYYQKAALYRQFQAWDALAKLTSTVYDKGFNPLSASSNAPFEWWPFIESEIRQGRFENAEELTIQSIQADPAYKDFFCNRWDQLIKEIPVSYNTDTVCTQ